MKKIKYKIIALLGVVSVSFWATSCLKDKYTDFSKVGDVVEFLDAIPSGATAVSFANPNSPVGDTILIRVNQAGPTATANDITLTIGVGNKGLANYNLIAPVTGTLLGDSSYSFPTSVTIKAGIDAAGNANRSATFPLIIYPSKVPKTLGVNYVLALEITGTSGGTISGNFGDILFNFFHNIYDGDYTSVGTRFNFNATADYTGWDPVANAPLSTPASTSPWNYPHAPILTVTSTTSSVHEGNDLSAFGRYNITVNPDNTVTIASTCPAGNCGGSATGVNGLVPLAGTGAPQSTYNPATKTFNLYYQYQNLNTDGTPSSFRVLHDVLTHN